MKTVLSHLYLAALILLSLLQLKVVRASDVSPNDVVRVVIRHE